MLTFLLWFFSAFSQSLYKSRSKCAICRKGPQKLALVPIDVRTGTSKRRKSSAIAKPKRVHPEGSEAKGSEGKRSEGKRRGAKSPEVTRSLPYKKHVKKRSHPKSPEAKRSEGKRSKRGAQCNASHVLDPPACCPFCVFVVKCFHHGR